MEWSHQPQLLQNSQAWELPIASNSALLYDRVIQLEAQRHGDFSKSMDS